MTDAMLVERLTQLQVCLQTDPVFRSSVLASPRTELERFLGTDLPPEATDSAIRRHLVASAEGAALSDAELEGVSGGGNLLLDWIWHLFHGDSHTHTAGWHLF